MKSNGADRVDRLALALIQMQCTDDARENLAKAVGYIEEAAAQGAELVCLQELFTRPYPCQSQDASRFDWAEPIPGPTSEALCRVAAAQKVALLASVFERRAAGVYHNTALVIDPRGAVAGRYRKMHIPDDPLYYEKYYFTPGDLGFQSHAVSRAGAVPPLQVGALICWDQWYPEAARLTALAGAQILVYPSAIGWQFEEGAAEDTAQHAAWEAMQRSHAIANGVFVAAVNRVGFERLPDAAPGEGIRFWGQSFVADPFGKVLARASAEHEQLLLVECDLGAIERTRRQWPFLRDRRVDAYAELDQLQRDP